MKRAIPTKQWNYHDINILYNKGFRSAPDQLWMFRDTKKWKERVWTYGKNDWHYELNPHDYFHNQKRITRFFFSFGEMKRIIDLCEDDTQKKMPEKSTCNPKSLFPGTINHNQPLH